jgi:CopA family copper-resistance protein
MKILKIIIDLLKKSTRRSANLDFSAFRYSCTICTLRFGTQKTLFSTRLATFWAGLVAMIMVMLCSHTYAKTTEYNLTIDYKNVNITGNTVKRIAVNGQIPAPTLNFTDGDTAIIHVKNNLDVDSSIHWHGLLLAGKMDGVPGMNGFMGIKPQTRFTYKFKIRQSGTYWYHAHSMGQEQDGLYGSLVILPKPQDVHIKSDKDYVVVLSDFHDDDSGTIMGNLKKSSEYYVYVKRTVSDFFDDVKTDGFAAAWDNALAWGDMRMMPTDLADISNYTFLTNGYTSDKNWTGLFTTGERVRLRFINASAMSFFDVRIPDLKMQIVSADGQDVEAVEVDEFRFAPAETYDVIVTPTQNKAYRIVAESIDRAGFALSTLAPKMGMVGDMPKHRKMNLLTMTDMGMGHDMSGMDHSKMNHDMSGMDMSNMDHSKMNHDMSGMDMSNMDHSKMNHDMSAMDMSNMDHSKMNHDMSAMDMSNMDHSKMNHDMSGMDMPKSGWSDYGTPTGHKSLSYSDLRYYGTQSDIRPPQRDIVVELGGNMERYIWTLNGKKYNESSPVQLKYGERVRLKFVNNTMMAHPMHLHGMFVQIENGQPMDKLPNKHTVIVKPGTTYSVLLTANEAGEWAFHCHLLYHMMSGMMTKFVVAKLDKSDMPHGQGNKQMDMMQHSHH